MSPACFDCQFNIGVAYMAKKDEKAAEEAWKKALEMKPDYAEALNALSTLYNNQKRFDEAAAMSAKAAAGGGGGGNADATFNQGIILWNQGKIAEAKAKFEETIKANATHADAHYQLGMALLNEGKLRRSGRRIRKLREARARRPVRDAGEGDDRAAEEIAVLEVLRLLGSTCTNTFPDGWPRFAIASRTRPAAPAESRTTSG